MRTFTTLTKRPHGRTGAGRTSDQAAQAWADALFAGFQAVAGLALTENLLAFGGVLSRSGRNASHQGDTGHQAEQHMLFHLRDSSWIVTSFGRHFYGRRQSNLCS
jgi:hypothetical protein